MSYVTLGALTPALPPLSKNFDEKEAQAIAAKLAPAQRQGLLAAALRAMPACWGARSQNCVNARYDTNLIWPMERCRALAYGYVGDWKAMEAAIDRTPNCDERAPLVTGIAAGVGGLVLGVLLGRALRR